jgi:hypothetical protein
MTDDPMNLDSLGPLPPHPPSTLRPAHGGYPDADTMTAYRIRLEGDRYEGTVTNALLHIASEFPGSRQVIIDVAHSSLPDAATHTVSLPCWINPDDPAWLPALRRVLRAHER